jgi:sigma-B regulation protein RsbU (phosphoserine phosphatase)
VARELEIAHQIQSSLLPKERVKFTGLDVAGECRPAAQVGGDYVGFRELSPGELTCTLFDVTGHGIGAALCMTLVRSALHGELVRGGSLASVLRGASRLVADDLAGSALFATAFVARFDRAAGTASYCSAGHPQPIHWSARKQAFVEHPEGGIPLGLGEDVQYPDASTPFEKGDIMVAYTDGILEARSSVGEDFGRERLVALVRRCRMRSADAILQEVWREVDAFMDGRPLHDDATLLVVRGVSGFGDSRPAASRRRGARAGARAR